MIFASSPFSSHQSFRVTFNYIFVIIFLAMAAMNFYVCKHETHLNFWTKNINLFVKRHLLASHFFHFERFMPYLECFTRKTVDQPGLYFVTTLLSEMNKDYN